MRSSPRARLSLYQVLRRPHVLLKMWCECPGRRGVLQRLWASGAGYVRRTPSPSRLHATLASSASHPISASLRASRASSVANKRAAPGCLCRILAALGGLPHRFDRSLFCGHDYYASVHRLHGATGNYARPHAHVPGGMDATHGRVYPPNLNQDGAELALLRIAGKFGLASNPRKKSAGFGSHRLGRSAYKFRARHWPFLRQNDFRIDIVDWIHHGGLHRKETGAARYDCWHTGHPQAVEFLKPKEFRGAECIAQSVGRQFLKTPPSAPRVVKR